jgi:pilus assembly protein Flp/PilA
MLSLLTKFQVRLQLRERGATAVEYGLIAALIAVVIVVAVTYFGKQVSGLMMNNAVSF